jgi:large subunit ribosomal protein L25
MLQVDVTARVRSNFGKGAARSLRRAGQTPAVLYGPKTDPIALELDTRSFTKTLLGLKRRNAVVTLDVEGGDKRHVLIRELQVDPVQDTLTHADFYEIHLDEPSIFSVPIQYEGNAVGVELGGELSIHIASVDIQGKPLDIPDFIPLDISSLELGDKLTCSDMSIPENVSLLDDADKVCIAIVTASAEPEELEEEEVEAAEAEGDSESQEETPASE